MGGGGMGGGGGLLPAAAATAAGVAGGALLFQGIESLFGQHASAGILGGQAMTPGLGETSSELLWRRWRRSGEDQDFGGGSYDSSGCGFQLEPGFAAAVTSAGAKITARPGFQPAGPGFRAATPAAATATSAEAPTPTRSLIPARVRGTAWAGGSPSNDPGAAEVRDFAWCVAVFGEDGIGVGANSGGGFRRRGRRGQI